MSTLTKARELPVATKVLLGTNAVNSFGGGLVLPFLWIYLTQVRHLSVWVVAATLTIRAVCAILGGLCWGALLDRAPYRLVVPLVMTVAGIGTSLYAVSVNVPLAILAAVVYGVGISGVGTVLRSVYAKTTSGRQRGLAYSLDFGIFNAMCGLGVIVGGVVATADFASAATRYSLLYFGDGFSFVLTGAVAAILLAPIRQERTANAPAAAASGAPTGGARRRSGYLAVLADRRLLAAYGVLLAAFLVSNGQNTSGLPGFLTDRHALGAGGLSFIVTVNIVVAVAVQFLGMPYLARVPRTRMLELSGVAFAAGWLLVGLAGGRHGGAALLLAAAGSGVMAVGEVFVIPVTNTLVNELVGDELRGRANALLSTTASSSSVVGPVIAGVTLPLAGGMPLIAAVLALCLIQLVLALRLGRLLPDGSAHDGDPAPELTPDPVLESAS